MHLRMQTCKIRIVFGCKVSLNLKISWMTVLHFTSAQQFRTEIYSSPTKKRKRKNIWDSLEQSNNILLSICHSTWHDCLNRYSYYNSRHCSTSETGSIIEKRCVLLEGKGCTQKQKQYLAVAFSLVTLSTAEIRFSEYKVEKWAYSNQQATSV